MTATATATAAPQATTALQTPPVPEARPETLGLSRSLLQAMSDAFKREIDKGTVPGVTVLVARRGQIGWFEALGKQGPTGDAAMARDSIFRIFSMTKPIVSVGIMALVEDGQLLLGDAVAKFIPEFASQKVGVVKDGKLELVPPTRPMTVQDLLRHTSGLTYEHQGDGPVHKLYQESRVRSRKISNAEHAALVASFPLVCQPGAEFNYSRSTDILGRIIEVVSGKTLGTFLTERMLAPLQMAETGFSTS
ncbi:serine hydrolase domain-containing protein, partial [Bradyrhizobium liaoningense]